MAKKVTFSPAMIDALCEGCIADPQTPGLAIEVLKSGKKRWRYRRQVARQKVVATLFGGLFPAKSMADAREWVFPALKIDGPLNNSVWYKCRDRVLARMEKLAEHPIERFIPHDFRRTARSNTKRLKVDFETAEAMLNHVKKGMERTYDLYEMEDEKRNWFLKWEEDVAAIAKRVGVAVALKICGT